MFSEPVAFCVAAPWSGRAVGGERLSFKQAHRKVRAMAHGPRLIEFDSTDDLAPYADALALRLGSSGVVFVPRPAVDPRARSAVPRATTLVVRIDTPAGERLVADWLEATASQLSSRTISGRTAGKSRSFSADGEDALEILRSLVGNG